MFGIRRIETKGMTEEKRGKTEFWEKNKEREAEKKLKICQFWLGLRYYKEKTSSFIDWKLGLKHASNMHRWRMMGTMMIQV